MVETNVQSGITNLVIHKHVPGSGIDYSATTVRLGLAENKSPDRIYETVVRIGIRMLWKGKGIGR
jgi:hypothetical protein